MLTVIILCTWIYKPNHYQHVATCRCCEHQQMEPGCTQHQQQCRLLTVHDSAVICVQPQALQEAEDTSTHQSSTPPSCSGCAQYCSLPHSSKWQWNSCIDNCTTRVLFWLNPLRYCIVYRELDIHAMFPSTKRSRSSGPASYTGRNLHSHLSSHCLSNSYNIIHGRGLQ